MILIVFTLMVFWPVLLWRYFSKPESRSVYDVLMENPQTRELVELHKLYGELFGEGINADELPNGSGEFGLTASNPIPCRTILGSNAYLGRLRTSDGATVLYERTGSVFSEVSSQPNDCYAIRHPNGRDLGTVYISPFQERNSAKAPRGFEIEEFDQS